MPFRFLPSRWRFPCALVAGLVSLVTMDGLLISGLLVIPCVSAGTLAISVGSKVNLSGCLVMLTLSGMVVSCAALSVQEKGEVG